jgi:hypothetical protein
MPSGLSGKTMPLVPDHIDICGSWQLQADVEARKKRLKRELQRQLVPAWWVQEGLWWKKEVTQQ